MQLHCKEKKNEACFSETKTNLDEMIYAQMMSFKTREGNAHLSILTTFEIKKRWKEIDGGFSFLFFLSQSYL